MGRGPHRIEPGDYQKVLAVWSRTLRVLPKDGLENILTAKATYLSHEFRTAYVVRMADDLQLTDEERRREEAEQMAALMGGHELFVSLMSGVKDCDKLDPEDRVWTIRLKDDRGNEVAPLRVIEVERPTPNEIKYFAFDAGYRKAFRLLFPLTGDNGAPIISATTKHFDLSFATAYGAGAIRWEIQ